MAAVTATVAVGTSAARKATATPACQRRKRADSPLGPEPRAMASPASSSRRAQASASWATRSAPSCPAHAWRALRTRRFWTRRTPNPVARRRRVGPTVISQIPEGVTKPRAASRTEKPKPRASQMALPRTSPPPWRRAPAIRAR